ncbi:PAS domain-containing sensor histidine kinase [Phenylobacterium sp.]|uniref:hybrid sensor histidine kinase/response regulator n=1 Tax=Phenylobacterium sp. TaxID=1871053 RepID=UPI002733019F|nr:PAS domain-containing sensor histidine kinase [Phenylobacterium sp.]MDP3852561.1 PAS domain-containing protein [Phenylobacterium sp.]
MPLTPVEWPLRLVPRRSPPLIRGAAISLVAMAAAILSRGGILGWENAFGLSVTYFPAFIIATLYAGQGWGWATLATALAIGLIAGGPSPPGISGPAVMVMFTLSGALTVLVAAALRSVLLRLGEAQADLDASESSLLLAQEAGSVGLWNWDLINGGGYWSPMLYRNLGLPLDTPVSLRALLDVIHPDDRERVRRSNLGAGREGRVNPTEYRVIWPDGQVRWLLARGELLRDDQGRVTRALGVNIDITERRLAFEQVRESEARFRALADSAPVLLWVSKTNGKREFVNQAYVDYLGVTYDEATNFDWRQRLHEEDLPRILREQVAGEASRATFTLEARYRRSDDEWRWIRSISQPRQGPTGEFIGFIGIGFDVTAAKQAEADLMRINDLLAERVEGAMAERDAVEAQLRHAQKLEAVGQLTGGVAHDFNNLLTVIIGALDLMQRHPDDAARRTRMLDAAQNAARRGERLTQQLLAFARRQALKPEAVRIDWLVAESEPLLRQASGEAAVLIVVPGADEAVAMIDPGQFEAALMNLVVNARDAVGQGGVIRIETAPCELGKGEVPDTAPGSYVCVTVCDTGVGMAPDIVGRVFEPFFTTKEIGKGTGLGLSQVYGFAHQSGGGVTIETAPDQGATVRLYLPRTTAAAGPAPETSSGPKAAEPGGPALTILLVEDDAEVAGMVSAMLADIGHEVIHADGTAAALELLRGGQAADLMVTDLVMPGEKSGVDLAYEAVTLRPGLPVILSSGYAGETLNSVDGAPWPLLRKPYTAQTLARAIRGAMDRAAETIS